METPAAPNPVIGTSPSPAKKNNLFPIIVTVLILLGLGFVMALSVKPPSRPPQAQPTAGPSPTPTLIPHPILGSMSINTKDGLKRYQAGKPVTLVIRASSEGRRIIGYDAILSYDNEGFSYQSARSMSGDFQLYSYDRKTYVAFSGIRSLQSTALDTWSNFPLLEVAMMPKKQGNYTFLLAPAGREASKLVDDKAQVVYPKTAELHLEIY